MSDEPKPQDTPDQPPPGQDPEKTVPYNRFKEINDRNKELSTRLAELEQFKQQREEQDLEAEKKWKELADKRDKSLSEQRLENRRLRIAYEKGLPFDLAERLQGDTQEDMEADAEKLLTLVKAPSGPGVPPTTRGGNPQRLDIRTMSPKEIRENRARLLRQAASSS